MYVVGHIMGGKTERKGKGGGTKGEAEKWARVVEEGKGEEEGGW